MFGISFDISGISEVIFSNRALKRMSNLWFFSITKAEIFTLSKVTTLEGIYPNKCLNPTFNPEYLVKLDMQNNQLEYLWKGAQVSVVLYMIKYFLFMLYHDVPLSLLLCGFTFERTPRSFKCYKA